MRFPCGSRTTGSARQQGTTHEHQWIDGANRGLGLSLVRLLREAGCKKIYAAARQPAELGAAVEYPVLLDITNPEQVTAAAAQCHDVDLLINNAGIAKFTPLLAAPSTDNARAEMETNYFGTMAMCRAFAPVLKRNGLCLAADARRRNKRLGAAHW
jgi:NAD(P)-dependent dehydrogenase (short-subunit alcohol dehydrogenase family)